MPALVNPLAKQGDVSSANRRLANPNSLRSLLSGRGGAARDDQDVVSSSKRQEMGAQAAGVMPPMTPQVGSGHLYNTTRGFSRIKSQV